jgi:hypothetical protein
LARNGRTYQITSYELEMRNPSREVLRIILQCYLTSFIWTQGTGTVPGCQEFESQNRAVLAQNGTTYPITSNERETRNPSREVLRIILQCYPTSFIQTQATGAVSTCQNRNRRIAPFFHEMGERTQSLRMSLKREILQGRCSGAYYKAIRQVSSGHKRPARFWHAKNPNRKIAPFWHESGERAQSPLMSSKR